MNRTLIPRYPRANRNSLRALSLGIASTECSVAMGNWGGMTVTEKYKAGSVRVAVTLLLALSPVGGSWAAPDAPPARGTAAYLDSSLPVCAARGRSDQPHDAAGEDLPAQQRRSTNTAPARTAVQLLERGAAWRRPRRHCHRISPGHRRRRHFRYAIGQAHGRGYRPGSPCQVRCGTRQGRGQAVPGTDVLFSQHQHLPRPAVGGVVRKPTARIRS